MSPKRDSPWFSTPKAKRRRKPIEICLSELAHEALSTLAEDDPEGRSRSQIVESLIWKACGMEEFE